MRALGLVVLASALGCINIPNVDGNFYPCDGGAGQCPGGWVCGVSLDGGAATCHAPVPSTYACNTSQDCLGWLCSTADHTCHDPSADAGGYPCAQPSDCVYPLACGLGTCVNVAPDQLDPNTVLTYLDAGNLLSPLSASGPDLFELSLPYAFQDSFPGNSGQLPAQDFALAYGTNIRLGLMTPTGFQAGSGGQQGHAETVTIAAPAKPLAMGLLGRALIWSDGNAAYAFVLDGGGPFLSAGPISGTLPLVPTAFRASDQQSMYAFNDGGYLYFSLPAGSDMPTLASPSPQVVQSSANAILDVVDTEFGALAATDHGLFFSATVPPTSFTWQPVQAAGSYDGGSWVLFNSACAMPSTATHLQPIRVYPGQALGNGNATLVEALDPSGNAVLTQIGLNTSALCSGSGTSMQPPCPVCPDPTDELVGVLFEGFTNCNNPGLGVVPAVRCRQFTDAGAVERVFQLLPPDPTRSDRSVCGWESPEGYPLARYEKDLSLSETSLPIRAGFAGQHGQIWFTPAPDGGGAPGACSLEGGLMDIHAVYLDSTPETFVDLNIAGFNFSAAATSTTTWTLEHSGFAAANINGQGLEILGQVQGERRWGALEVSGTDEIVDSRTLTEAVPPALAVLDSSREGMKPVHASLAQTQDGGFSILVTEFDALMVGDVTQFAPGQPFGPPVEIPISLPIVLVPQSGIPVIAIAPVNPPRNGLAEAYLLTPLEIVHATSIGNGRWVSDIVPPPNDPSQWIDTWADGDRARIGFASGVVYALPTGVPLSEAIPDPNPVLSYVQTCQTTFAATQQALYRLTPQASGMAGTWTDVTAEAGLPAGVTFAGASLYWSDDALALFDQYGRAFLLPFASGCGPD